LKAKTINLDRIKRSVAVIADTHVGSDYAPWPEMPIYTDTGKNLSAGVSDGQSDLLKAWYTFGATCDEFRVDTIIHLGDACQGCNPRENGVDTVTPDINYQVEGATVLMEDLVRGRTYHQFSGTAYHEAQNYKIHSDLVSKLHPITEDAAFHGKFANIRLRGTSKVLNLAHACSYSTMYPAAALDREILGIKVAVSEGKIPRPDYLMRGHSHKYVHLDYPNIHAVLVPGWQAWYPMGDKVVMYGKTQPDIGGVIVLVDDDDHSFVIHFTYKCPNIIDFVRDG